jgi:hypothetical protein
MTNSDATGAQSNCQEIAHLQPMGPGPMQPKEKETIYNIAIRQIDHGYLVEVGCKTFAIETSTRLITLLSTYLLQPAATQKQYEQGKLL